MTRSLQHVRTPARFAAALASLALVPLAALPSLANAPAAQPHPAAPPGGCAVTQDATVRVDSPTTVTGLKRTKARRTSTWVRQLPDGQWQARVAVVSRWKGTATATSGGSYASADCDVAPKTVTATRTRATDVRVSWAATRKASTRKGAVNAAIRTAKSRSKSLARADLTTLAHEAAGLAARRSFLQALPDRGIPAPQHWPLPTRAQACPTKLAPLSDKQWSAASTKSALVPQFEDVAATWVCRYSHSDGHVVTRTKITGAAQRRLVAGLRSIRVLDPRISEACTAEAGSTYLVTHVNQRGQWISVVVNDFGCRTVRLTSDPKRVPAGAKVSAGVPSGYYGPSDMLLKVIRSA